MCVRKVYIVVCVCCCMGADWTYLKEQMKESCLSSIKEATSQGRAVEKHKLIAVLALDFGFREAKVKEFIGLLLRTGKIEEDEEGLWFK